MGAAMKIKLLFIAILTCCVTGCFSYKETIVINEDGSGVMFVHYYGIQGSHTDIDDDNDIFFVFGHDEDIKYRVIDDFTTEKVKLTNFSIRKRGSKKHVYFTIEFPSIEELNKTYKFRRNKI